MTIYLDEASAICDRLSAEAIHFRDQCTWVTRTVPYSATGGPGDRYPELMTLNPSIYSGTAGLGLLLARIGYYTGVDEHFSTARSAINHAIANAWYRDQSDAVGEIGGRWRFGFYLGTLGIAWAAQEFGELTGIDFYAAECRRLLRELSATFDLPKDSDVIFGAAGAVAPLLSLADRGVEGALDLALRLGEDILATGQSDGRTLSWGAGEAPALAGFSHGTAGYGAALFQLGAVTGDSRFTEGGAAAFAYERKVFNAKEGNWPNFQSPRNGDGSYPCATAWCHGAPGIGIGRILAHRAAPAVSHVREAEIAAAATRKQVAADLAAPGKDVMLCHGVVGGLDALWFIEEGLGVEDRVEFQRAAAEYLISLYGSAARSEHGVLIEWPTGVAGGTYPTLVTGIGGVAHWLLQLHAPDQVPSVLAPGLSMKIPALV